MLAHAAAQPSVEPLRVAIVGGGLAGLAAAVALTTRGLSVTVFERDRGNAFSQALTGIQLWPWGLYALGRIEASSSLRQKVLASGDVVRSPLAARHHGGSSNAAVQRSGSDALFRCPACAWPCLCPARVWLCL